jgi:hypothetical protein
MMARMILQISLNPNVSFGHIGHNSVPRRTIARATRTQGDLRGSEGHDISL